MVEVKICASGWVRNRQWEAVGLGLSGEALLTLTREFRAPRRLCPSCFFMLSNFSTIAFFFLTMFSRNFRRFSNKSSR